MPTRLFELHRAAGNRAVGQILATMSEVRVQRSPDDERPGLPWSFGDYVQFEQTASGVRFLVGVAKTQERAARAVIASLAARIAADNASIADPARRVTTCLITPATTRFAYWGTKQVLILDPADADLPTVAHEMGHAVLDALMHASKGGASTTSGAAVGTSRQAGSTTSIPARIADLYLRLEATKPAKDSTAAVGLLMVDPSEWSPGAKSEHPWENADEFFASAKAAFQVSPKGLAKSIARATEVDSSVGPLAKELLALLGALFGKGKLPGDALPADRAKAAAAELGQVKSASQIEDSIPIYPQLGWLIDPASRPGGR